MPEVVYEQILPFMVRVRVNDENRVTEVELRLQASCLLTCGDEIVSVDRGLLNLIAQTVIEVK